MDVKTLVKAQGEVLPRGYVVLLQQLTENVEVYWSWEVEWERRRGLSEVGQI